MASTLKTRLRRVMRAMRWSQADLAVVCGASKQTVSRWLADGRIKMDPAFAFAIEDASGFDARWILLGGGHQHVLPAVGPLAQLPDFLTDEYVRHLTIVVARLRERASLANGTEVPRMGK